MRTCFVIQPFDEGGPFDRRYNDVLAPAIKDAGLEPYRVDRDQSATVPIQWIERRIKDAAICLAEISEDNPNVWFELGFAIASGQEVVLLCSRDRRSSFPFDVQHRKIIQYEAASPSDFSTVQSKITKTLTAVLSNAETRRLTRSTTEEVDPNTSVGPTPLRVGPGPLRAEEISSLATVIEELGDPGDGVSLFRYQKRMQECGFSRVDSALAVEGLVRRGMLERCKEEDYQGDAYPALKITAEGMEWLLTNRANLPLRNRNSASQSVEITDDDIPF